MVPAGGSKKEKIITQGISPYFLTRLQVIDILRQELLPKLGKQEPDEIYFYGTGCSNPENVSLVRHALKTSSICQSTGRPRPDGCCQSALRPFKGIACILGTGSNSCYFNGKKIVKNSPGLGYVLGDEGSGAYLGKKWSNIICTTPLIPI